MSKKLFEHTSQGHLVEIVSASLLKSQWKCLTCKIGWVEYENESNCDEADNLKGEEKLCITTGSQESIAKVTESSNTTNTKIKSDGYVISSLRTWAKMLSGMKTANTDGYQKMNMKDSREENKK